MQQPFNIVKTPIQLQLRRATRMPKQSQLLLKALLGLKEGMSIQFECPDASEAFRISKVLIRFIYEARKSGKLRKKYSVHRRKIEEGKKESWFVFVVLKYGKG